MIEIRKEIPSDSVAIHRINMVAFDKGPEADLVDRLRASCDQYVSFVAVKDGSVVGHILFTPAIIENGSISGMGLAPMAVLPSYQNKGIGSKLVLHGMNYLRNTDCPFVIVLGHPEYYPRFGYEPASKYGIRSQWEGIPDEVFMISVFVPDALPKTGGVARYRDEFDDAM